MNSKTNAKRCLMIVLALLIGVGGQAKADFVFGTPTNLGPTVNSAVEEFGVSLSADGLSLYFSSRRPGGEGHNDIWVSTRATKEDDWAAPVNLGPPINSSAAEVNPCISADGLELYFNDHPTGPRPGSLGDGTIWVTRRATVSDAWGIPENLGPTINTSSAEAFPSLSADGLSLFFGSSWPNPGSASDWDLYVTRRATVDEAWSEPVNLGETVNSASTDAFSGISADNLTLFFGSMRPGGSGGVDLWITRRATISDPWTEPANLGPTVNSAGLDVTPNLSPDGLTLYFVSNRAGGSGGFDLWQVPISPVVDFNGDGKVDGGEVRIMASRWGENHPSCDIGPTPLGDGVIDVQDLIVLADYIGDVDDPTLVAHWAFDETEGSAALDNVANSNSTIVGLPTWRPAGGKVDGALQLNGMTFIMGGFVLNPSDGPFSVLAWVKGGVPGQGIVTQQGGMDWLMADPVEGRLATELSPALCSEALITDGNWHRIGVTWDGSDCLLYVDDVLEAQSAEDGLAGSAGGVVIGCRKTMTPGTFFTGLIDDVRIYNRAVKP